MNRKKEKPLVNITLTQLGTAILNFCAVSCAIIWEIPKRNFPQTPYFFSDVRVDYWKDIFKPAVSFPLIFLIIVLVLKILGLFLSFRVAKERSLIWTIGVSASTLIDVLFLWVSILWVHAALICIEDSLRYGGGPFGCEFDFRPEIWQIVVGGIFSILLIVSQAFLTRQIFTTAHGR